MIKKSVVFIFCTCVFSLCMFGRMIVNMNNYNGCHSNEYESFKKEFFNSSRVTEGRKDFSNSILSFGDNFRMKMKAISNNLESQNDEKWNRMQTQRRNHLNRQCMELRNQNRSVATLNELMTSYNRFRLANILVDDRHKLLYCYIPKVACTPWKKIMMVLTGNATLKDLDRIGPARVHYASGVKPLMSQKFKEKDILERIMTYKKFLIVRHPAERLLSAYKDKFVSNKFDSNDFKKIYAVPMMRFARNTSKNIPLTGTGLKFKEFLHYILSQNPIILQEHWRPFFYLCHPCSIDYDYIGKYETLDIDSNQILKRIGAPPGLNFPPFQRTNTATQLKNMLLAIPKNILIKFYEIFKPDFSLFNYIPNPIS